MNEYIRLMLEQIRCKKAHPMIETEIRSHIEEQIEYNLECGMSANEAEVAAIKDMGSPVENGISLDMVHKPNMAWDIVILVAILSAVAILLHHNTNFILLTCLGFFLMLLVYRIDYSLIAKYAKWIGIGLLFFILQFSYTMGISIVGGDEIIQHNLRMYLYSPLSHALLLFYVPIYCALLYQYYGTGKLGVFKSLIWMFIPLFISWDLSLLSISFVLFFSMAVAFSLAVWKGWFQVSKGFTLTLFWSITILAPILLLFLGQSFHWTASHKEMELILAFNDKNDFTFTSLISNFGVLVGILISFILILLFLRLIKVSLKQKNQLGMLMGCGCGMVLLTTAFLNILGNLGLIQNLQAFLPLVSDNGSLILASYILLGVVMSVYRYKNILPAHIVWTRKKTRLSA